jgi:hypothetical protein
LKHKITYDGKKAPHANKRLIEGEKSRFDFWVDDITAKGELLPSPAMKPKTNKVSKPKNKDVIQPTLPGINVTPRLRSVPTEVRVPGRNTVSLQSKWGKSFHFSSIGDKLLLAIINVCSKEEICGPDPKSEVPDYTTAIRKFGETH